MHAVYWVSGHLAVACTIAFLGKAGFCFEMNHFYTLCTTLAGKRNHVSLVFLSYEGGVYYGASALCKVVADSFIDTLPHLSIVCLVARVSGELLMVCLLCGHGNASLSHSLETHSARAGGFPALAVDTLRLTAFLHGETRVSPTPFPVRFSAPRKYSTPTEALTRRPLMALKCGHGESNSDLLLGRQSFYH